MALFGSIIMITLIIMFFTIHLFTNYISSLGTELGIYDLHRNTMFRLGLVHSSEDLRSSVQNFINTSDYSKVTLTCLCPETRQHSLEERANDCSGEGKPAQPNQFSLIRSVKKLEEAISLLIMIRSFFDNIKILICKSVNIAVTCIIANLFRVLTICWGLYPECYLYETINPHNLGSQTWFLSAAPR